MASRALKDSKKKYKTCVLIERKKKQNRLIKKILNPIFGNIV